MANLSSIFGANRTIPIEVFAVGGGGGGASFSTSGAGGSGGGAGMVLYKKMDVRVGTTYNISIGAGGAGGAPTPGPSGNPGSSGGNTSFGSLTAYGGSGGDMFYNINSIPSLMNYGSVGGGTGPRRIDSHSTTSIPGPFYTNEYSIIFGSSDFHPNSKQSFDADGGFVGVNGWKYSYYAPTIAESGVIYPPSPFETPLVNNNLLPAVILTSGGGGAGSAGQPNGGNGPAPYGGSTYGPAGAGAGGYGVSGTLIGLTTSYAGGGGAGNHNPSPGFGSWPGGLGRDGGANGAGSNSGGAGPGAAANRGGGGGGGAISTPTANTGGSAGGSGFLFIRYPTAYAAASVTGNAPVTAQPGYNVYGWTSGPATILFN